MTITANCTGCSACASACPQKCIEMCPNEHGFLFPKINLDECIQCGLCKEICPVLNPVTVSVRTDAFAAKNKNNEERNYSASGGFFPVIAKYVLEQGGLVFGAAWDEDFSVKHIAVTQPDELYMLQSAKYIQSRLGSSFGEIRQALKNNRTVLFSGTPCQCAGLKSYLGEEYKNLITVDLICHGVASLKVLQYYIDCRSRQENGGIRPKKINFRSKVTGWSRYGYSVEFDYGNGKKELVSNKQDSFMKAFVGNLCLNNSCANCKSKGTERCTDFTLGDFWGIWDLHPSFDDNKGTSLVLVHSEKGRSLLRKLETQIELLSVDLEAAYAQNPSLIQSASPHMGRNDFLCAVNADNFIQLVSAAFSLPKSSNRFFKIKTKLRQLLG